MRNHVATRVFAGTLVLAAPAVAFGAEGGPGDVVAINPWQFAAALIVFGASVFVLQKTAWPKILGGLEERENKIREEIFAAEEARKRADAALKDYEASLAEARAEANRMIEATKAEQARMAADLRAKAEAEVTQLRESAMRGIEAAKRAALSEIYAETADLSTRVAAKILERDVNEDDQRRLVDESVNEYTSTYAGA
ncbi:MAG: F0F1 ATP synthase subunit B [Planctomycetota bacterium]